MSRHELELAREVHEAFNAADLDRFVNAWHDECEYRPALEGALEGRGGVYRGHQGIRRWWQGMREAWSEMGTEIEEIRDLGDGRVLVCVVLRTRAEAADIGLDAPFFQLAAIRDGRILSSRDFSDRAAALEAAGLRE